MALSLMILSGMSLSAYAEPGNIDEFGNEIDWDINGNGNEDAAGNEGDYAPINADLLDTERMEQSEAESIADVINEIKLDENEIENGIITLKFDAPEEWRGNNIVVNLYNKDLWQSYDVYIYKQNDFTEQKELPCGEYEIRGAAVVGDMNGVYPLLVDANGRTGFGLQQGGEKIVINVELAGSNNYIKETESIETDENINTEEQEIKQETALEKTAKEFAKENLVFAVLLVIGLVGFALYKRKSGRDEEDED